jgi:hypothetical protein
VDIRLQSSVESQSCSKTAVYHQLQGDGRRKKVGSAIYLKYGSKGERVFPDSGISRQVAVSIRQRKKSPVSWWNGHERLEHPEGILSGARARQEAGERFSVTSGRRLESLKRTSPAVDKAFSHQKTSQI